jgi:hypothetical protein
MTRIAILLVLLSFSVSGWAQSFDEWFRQKKTQLDYLRKQIAALQAYAKATEDGYSIVQRGTEAITAIKKGDYDLHSNYFDDLMHVRPPVSRYATIQAIIDLQDGTVNLSAETNKQAKVLSGWTETVAAFFRGLLEDNANDLDLLKKLITGGRVQLSDADRLGAIDRVYMRMQDRYKTGVRVWYDVIFLRNNLKV